MKSMMRMYLSHHPLKSELKEGKAIPLLVNYKGEAFDQTNSITRILNKIFDKKIGASMLRNIFATDRFSEKQQDLQDTATEMGTSGGTLQNVYIKVAEPASEPVVTITGGDVPAPPAKE